MNVSEHYTAEIPDAAPRVQRQAPVRRTFTETEAQARSLIARRVNRSAVSLDDAQWSLTLVPLLDWGPWTCGADQWQVAANWSGAPFELQLSPVAPRAWIAGSFPELDVPELPPEYAAVALEVACGRVLSQLNSLGRGSLRIESVACGPVAGLSLPHGFDLEARRGDEVVRARLATDSLGLMLLAGLVAERPEAPNQLALDTLPLAVRAEIGFTWLAAPEIESLGVGDAVLIEHAFITPDREVWLGDCEWGLRVRWNDTSLTVTTGWNRGGWTMPTDHDAPADREPPLGALAALPLRLAFDLGERTISLGELRTMQVGDTIDLGRPLSSAVNLRVNGRLVATGELVEIDGRLGVAVSRLHLVDKAADLSADHSAAPVEAGLRGQADGQISPERAEDESDELSEADDE